jgi:hypothetical protein
MFQSHATIFKCYIRMGVISDVIECASPEFSCTALRILKCNKVFWLAHNNSYKHASIKNHLSNVEEKVKFCEFCVLCSELRPVWLANTQNKPQIQVSYRGVSGSLPGSPCELFMDKVVLGHFSLRILRFFPCEYNSTAAPYPYIL